MDRTNITIKLRLVFLNEFVVPSVNATERGRIIVVVFGAQPLTGAGTLLSLRFNTIGAVDSTSRLEWGSFLFNEGEVPFRTVDGQLRVTAATEGVINGRVVSQFGEPIRRTRVIAVDTAGNRRTATTSSFGHFQFGELQVGETYVLRVDSKRYRFAPQSVSLTSGVAAEVQLIAQD